MKLTLTEKSGSLNLGARQFQRDVDLSVKLWEGKEEVAGPKREGRNLPDQNWLCMTHLTADRDLARLDLSGQTFASRETRNAHMQRYQQTPEALRARRTKEGGQEPA